LIGRVRAAVLAAAALLATVVLGFAILPTDSTFYWLERNFDDINRISGDPFANTSVHGLFLRLHYPAALAAAVAIALAVAGLAVGAMAYRRGQPILAIAVVGMASTAVSPFSWSHHWVWFVPLVAHLGYRAYVLRSSLSAWAMWLLCALCGAWFVAFPGGTPQAGVLSLRPGGVWNEIIPATYVFAFVTVCIVSAVWLWRTRPARPPVTPVTPDLEPVGAEAL
jgi:alpha-1,2-mannosyltransferase